MLGFCPNCGSVLPLPANIGNTTRCYCCMAEHPLEVYGDMKGEYTIFFNPIISRREKSIVKGSKKEADGPVVRRKCPVCKNSKMSYATLHLRSADKGQTVFYTCTKCKYKETENS